MMRYQSHAAAALLTLVALIVTGCSSAGDPNASGGNTDDASLPAPATAILGDWALIAIEGTSLNDFDLQGLRATPSINIEPDGRVGGNAGVNRWFSSLNLAQLAQGRFAIGPAGSTKMAGPPSAMQIEDRFLGALARAARFDLDALQRNDNLRLLSGDGDELLHFVRRQGSDIAR
ncbi:MAG: META domain-containing protein [Phycisphaerales bacterium]